MDAYFGFLTLYVWVFYKELRRLPRIAWFVAITLLGNNRRYKRRYWSGLGFGFGF